MYCPDITIVAVLLLSLGYIRTTFVKVLILLLCTLLIWLFLLYWYYCGFIDTFSLYYIGTTIVTVMIIYCLLCLYGNGCCVVSYTVCCIDNTIVAIFILLLCTVLVILLWLHWFCYCVLYWNDYWVWLSSLVRPETQTMYIIIICRK